MKRGYSSGSAWCLPPTVRAGEVVETQGQHRQHIAGVVVGAIPLHDLNDRISAMAELAYERKTSFQISMSPYMSYPSDRSA